jgi:hypothetical protein
MSRESVLEFCVFSTWTRLLMTPDQQMPTSAADPAVVVINQRQRAVQVRQDNQHVMCKARTATYKRTIRKDLQKIKSSIICF